MRKLKTGMHRFTSIYVKEKETEGSNSLFDYYLCSEGNGFSTSLGEFGYVKFQCGPVKEAGVNGCFMEDLLSIVVDQLEGFQNGDFACRENAIALTKIQEALHWMNHRTKDRIERDVEGKYEK